MTDAPVPEPGPRELPGLDSWWDGSQWRRIGEPVEHPAYGQPVPNSWATPPAQHLAYGRPVDNPGYGRPVDNPGYGVPLANPATFPRPALAHVPQFYPTPPRRSRINSTLWTVAIIGAALVVSSLAKTMSPRATEPSQRTFVNIPVVEPAGKAGALPLDSAEAFAASYQAHRDAQGSYVASAQEITRAFGAEIIWADFGTPDPTTKCISSGETPASVLAWFCGAEPYLIRLNRVGYDMPGVTYTPVFVDAVKHELAHLVIQQRCGRSKPSAGTVELEGVTNSYAVLYLGADRKALGDLSSTFPEYASSTRTDEVATWIHSGVCWFESSDILK